MRPLTAVRLATALTTSAALASLARAGGVVIVDAPGLGVLPDLQTAVDSAVSGDALLVAPGSYAPFTIDGKSLSVFAIGDGVVSIAGTVEVKNLASSQRVVLSGLKATGAVLPTRSGAGLKLTDNAGAVRVQSCILVGGKGKLGTCNDNGEGGHGVDAFNSLRVAIASSSLTGGEGYGQQCCSSYDCTGGDGGDGLHALDSALALYDSTMTGGAGGRNGLYGGHGGHGAHATNFGIVAAGSSFTGGAGGQAWDFIAAYAGDGGDGLLVDVGTQAQLLDDTFAGGAGGDNVVFPEYEGEPGGTTTGGGIFNFHDGVARTFTAPAIAAEQADVPVAFSGQAGDLAWVFESSTPAWQLPAEVNGIWLIPKPARPRPGSGTVIGSGGTATLQQHMQTITSAPAGRIAYLQGYVIDPFARDSFPASPMHVLVLDRDALPDCDGNGVLDWIDLVDGATGDCDDDLATDACEIVSGSPDCNSNGVPDVCDIGTGTSLDVNGNTVPDECEAQQITYWVDDDAPAGGDGSAAAPFQRIGDGLAVSVEGDTVMVKDGLYRGAGNVNLLFGGRDVVLRSENGAASCVIDGEYISWLLRFQNAEPATARVQGFTIRNGGTTAVIVESVAGANPPTQPTFADCVFEVVDPGTGPLPQGRAVYARYSAPTFERCTFRNLRSGTGVAIFAEGGNTYSGGPPPHGSVRVRDCLFHDNNASEGGAIFLGASVKDVVIERCTFVHNTATVEGGAISSAATIGNTGPPLVRIDNCLFHGNSSPRGGAFSHSAGFAVYGSFAITNSTFVDNTASVRGGAVLVGDRGDGLVANCVFFGNTSPAGAHLAMRATGGGPAILTVRYSDVPGGQAGVPVPTIDTLNWGPGNLDADPLFVDADGLDGDPATFADNDYRLSVGSPCLDAGDNAGVAPDVLDLDGDANTSEPVPFDLDGGARFADVPSAPDVGAGVAPLVDMGSYERP